MKESAFDNTQGPKSPKFGFSKMARLSEVETKLKKTLKWPGAATYNPVKADNVITLGARRGWK